MLDTIWHQEVRVAAVVFAQDKLLGSKGMAVCEEFCDVYTDDYLEHFADWPRQCYETMALNLEVFSAWIRTLLFFFSISGHLHTHCNQDYILPSILILTQ